MSHVISSSRTRVGLYCGRSQSFGALQVRHAALSTSRGGGGAVEGVILFVPFDIFCIVLFRVNVLIHSMGP